MSKAEMIHDELIEKREIVAELKIEFSELKKEMGVKDEGFKKLEGIIRDVRATNKTRGDWIKTLESAMQEFVDYWGDQLKYIPDYNPEFKHFVKFKQLLEENEKKPS